MIALEYSVTCDNCQRTESKKIFFDSIEVMLYNKKAKQINIPALPHGWLSMPSRIAEKPELHFCSVNCKTLYSLPKTN